MKRMVTDEPDVLASVKLPPSAEPAETVFHEPE